MNEHQKPHPLCFLLFGTLLTIMLISPISVHSGNLRQTAAFLQAPYYGSTSVSSIFDHDGNWGRILALTGAAAEDDYCPCPDAPPGGCVDPDFPTGYYSCDVHAYLYYDNHRGIDYLLRYDYVRAATAGQVGYAGWQYPNHESGLGLYVRVNHSNGYQTLYGHMSILRVRTGDLVPESDEFRRILGISGSTGNSTGPHLHFEVQDTNGTPVDPYGPDSDPDHKLWIEQPSIIPHVIYPSGGYPVAAPPISEDEEGYRIVDDGDADFVEEPVGCWTVDNTAGWNNDYRYRNIPDGNCAATWDLPDDQPAGRYHVFIHIPNDNVAPDDRNATVDAAWYEVHHTASASLPWLKVSEVGIVDQWVYPNDYHTSRWVYVGTYFFNSNLQYGPDWIRLGTETLDSRPGMLAADAVRFVPVVYRTYLPLVMRRWPPIPDTPVLNAIYNPDNDGNYTVSWQPAYLADTYILQEATNANFTGAVTRYNGVGTSWSAVNQPVGTYYYRVKARNSWGDSGWSNVRQTTVWPPPVFYSVADACVLQGYPIQNFGGTTDMWAGYDDYLEPDGQIARSLVRFDLSAIPAGTFVGQATLWLYMWKSYDYEGAWRTITTYRITSSWSEGGVTWSVQPTCGEGYGSASILHGNFGWYPFDVTNLVRGWVNNAFYNQGLMLRGPESFTDPNWRGFCTRECPEEYQPYLVVTYGGIRVVPASPTDGDMEGVFVPTIVDRLGGSLPRGEGVEERSYRSEW